MVNDPGKNSRHVADHASLPGSGTYTHAQIDTHIDAAGALSELDTVGSAEIDSGAVTLAKHANVVTDSFLGRTTAATGAVEVLSATDARAVLNVENGSTADQAWGDIAGTLSAQTDLQSALDAKSATTHTHTLADVTDSGALAALNTVGTTEIDLLAVTAGEIATNACVTAKIKDANVTEAKLATSAVTTTKILDANVTLPKLASIATDSFLGRTTAATGAVEVLSAADARTVLNVADGATADQNIGNADQVLTANRTTTIASGTDYHQYINLIDDTGTNNQTASVLIQPVIPRVVVSAVETGVANTGFSCGSDNLNLIVSAGADQQINGDAGTVGDQYQCGGAGSPPVWASGMVHSATAPNTAQLWWHTTDLVLYAYDSSRTKWLSTHEEQYHFAISSTTTGNQILRQEGNLTAFVSDGRGRGVMNDITVTGWVWHVRGGGTSSRNTNLQKEDEAGTYTFNFYTSTPAGTWTVSRETTLDHDFDATDRIGVLLYSGASSQDPRCSVTYRRRPS